VSEGTGHMSFPSNLGHLFFCAHSLVIFIRPVTVTPYAHPHCLDVKLMGLYAGWS